VIKIKKQENKMLKIISSITLLSILAFSASNKDILQEKCKKEDATACYEIALPLISGDNAKAQDILEEGMSYMRKACILGENRGCDAMGKRYYKDANYAIARVYLEKSCNRGIKSACEAVGTIYRDGHDTKQDDIKSREFYEKACALKSGDACYNVAIIYRGGFGVTINREKEKEFYKKGCDVGLKAGCSRFTELDNEDKGIETGIFATIKSWFK
jgi:TPR repeat protein